LRNRKPRLRLSRILRFHLELEPLGRHDAKRGAAGADAEDANLDLHFLFGVGDEECVAGVELVNVHSVAFLSRVSIKLAVKRIAPYGLMVLFCITIGLFLSGQTALFFVALVVFGACAVIHGFIARPPSAR